MTENLLNLAASASRDELKAHSPGETVDCKIDLEPLLALDTEVDWSTSANICLLIDCSGSMTGEKIEAAVLAGKLIVEMLHERHQLSLVVFETDSRIIFKNAVPSEDNKDELKDQIEQLNSHLIGMTDMAAGIENAMECFAESTANTNIALVISDGVPDSVSKAQLLAEEASRQGVQFHAVGVGKDYNGDQLLSLVSPSNGAVYADDEVARMDDIFRGIVERIDRIFATNVRLSVDFDERAELLGVDRIAPERASLDISKLDHTSDNLKLKVGNIEGEHRYEFLLRFELDAFEPGRRELLGVRLDYDFYSDGLKTAQSQEVSLELSFVEQHQAPAAELAEETVEEALDAAAVEEAVEEATDAASVEEPDEETADAASVEDLVQVDMVEEVATGESGDTQPDADDLWTALDEYADLDEEEVSYDLSDTQPLPLDDALQQGPDDVDSDGQGILVEEYVLDEDTAASRLPADTGLFDLVLIDAGENPIRLMREIRDATDMQVHQAADIIRSTNTRVATLTGLENAESLQQRLAAVGGRAEIRANTDAADE